MALDQKTMNETVDQLMAIVREQLDDLDRDPQQDVAADDAVRQWMEGLKTMGLPANKTTMLVAVATIAPYAMRGGEELPDDEVLSALDSLWIGMLKRTRMMRRRELAAQGGGAGPTRTRTAADSAGLAIEHQLNKETRNRQVRSGVLADKPVDNVPMDAAMIKQAKADQRATRKRS